MAWLGTLLTLLTGCNPLAVEQIRVGTSTRSDVLRHMGQPERVHKAESGPWTGADVLDYSGQPEGTQNWQIVIGPDELVKEVRSLLTSENFDRIHPGMKLEDVRRMLGKPAKVNTYALTPNQHVEWRYLQPPNEVMLFSVEVDTQQRVVKTERGRDNIQDSRGG